MAAKRSLIRHLLLALAVLSAACGETPANPSPNPPSGYSTAGRILNVLDLGRVEATITLEGSEPITSHVNGSFVARSETPGTFRATITAPGYFERQTVISVPGSPADISLIPASFQMETYNQLARTAWDVLSEGMKSQRWVVAPRLIVYTRLLDCSKNAPEEITMLSAEIAESDIASAVAAMRTALDALTGGVFPEFSEVVRERGEVGERRILRGAQWDGWIHAGVCESLTQWGRDIDGGATTTSRSAPFVVSGGIALWTARISGVRRQQVQMHEFGHTLGLDHTFTYVPSIMSYTAPTFDVSWGDRQAGRVLYQRPPAHRIPDLDPPGFIVNAGAGSLGFLSADRSFSVRTATWMCPRPPGR